MAEGAQRNSRDSHGQRRGVKCFGGEKVTGGSIIVRQCGTKYYPGKNTGMGRDFSIYAKIAGIVEFEDKKNRKYINVKPLA